MDADMHRMNGIQVTQRIRASKGEVRVVLYSEQINWPTVWAAVDAGVDGYVCQAASVEEYLRAIRGDTGTGCYFCSQVTAKLLDSAFENTAIPTAPDWGPQVPRLLDNTVPSVRHRYISSALQAASHGQLLDQRKTSH
jgi:DNA-binding NarL/FixJ family response regulator